MFFGCDLQISHIFLKWKSNPSYQVVAATTVAIFLHLIRFAFADSMLALRKWWVNNYQLLL